MELALWALKPGWVAGTACSRPPLIWGLSHTALSRCQIYSGWLRASAWLQSSSTVPLQEHSFEKTYGGWENLFAVSLTDPDCNLLGPELWAHLGAPPLRFQFLLTRLFSWFRDREESRKRSFWFLSVSISSVLLASRKVPLFPLNTSVWDHIWSARYGAHVTCSGCFYVLLLLPPYMCMCTYTYICIHVHIHTHIHIHTDISITEICIFKLFFVVLELSAHCPILPFVHLTVLFFIISLSPLF